MEQPVERHGLREQPVEVGDARNRGTAQDGIAREQREIGEGEAQGAAGERGQDRRFHRPVVEPREPARGGGAPARDGREQRQGEDGEPRTEAPGGAEVARVVESPGDPGGERLRPEEDQQQAQERCGEDRRGPRIGRGAGAGSPAVRAHPGPRVIPQPRLWRE
ncbi:MAG: hypothetical protein E6K81_02590 [Candidatus Eisenbacteria bacterium]|uniref:Uncharacterized protein n=1 Tax=Eiseniibacteriota bacterium TaxID=2212470 RepID=A0A538UDE6_UNCEI|nr:MAG: hypothetical protein E6K81_02590 [Candidatus Eisenbacteria bacterium]